MTVRGETIVGGRQLDDTLKTLPGKLQRNVMRASLRAGAAVMREEVRSRAPVASGDLKKSVRVTSRISKGTVSASVKIGNKKAWYAHLVEFGTRPHKIKPKAGSLTVNGGEYGAVNHPGTTGHPFVRPAADAGFTPSVRAVEKRLRELLTAAGINSPAPVPSDPAE